MSRCVPGGRQPGWRVAVEADHQGHQGDPADDAGRGRGCPVEANLAIRLRTKNRPKPSILNGKSINMANCLHIVTQYRFENLPCATKIEQYWPDSQSRRCAMNRHDYILAVLSATGEQTQFSPVQVQKLFFLLDRELSGLVGGPHFDFQPYDYGPFDKNVYTLLGFMEVERLVDLIGGGRYRKYMLTSEGLRQGRSALAGLPHELQTYIADLSNWVRSLSFSQLVSEIYRLYPDMRANSVFR